MGRKAHRRNHEHSHKESKCCDTSKIIAFGQLLLISYENIRQAQLTTICSLDATTALIPASSPYTQQLNGDLTIVVPQFDSYACLNEVTATVLILADDTVFTLTGFDVTMTSEIVGGVYSYLITIPATSISGLVSAGAIIFTGTGYTTPAQGSTFSNTSAVI